MPNSSGMFMNCIHLLLFWLKSLVAIALRFVPIVFIPCGYASTFGSWGFIWLVVDGLIGRIDRWFCWYVKSEVQSLVASFVGHP